MLFSLIRIIKTRGPGPPWLAKVPRARVASVAHLLLTIQALWTRVSLLDDSSALTKMLLVRSNIFILSDFCAME